VLLKAAQSHQRGNRRQQLLQ